MNQEVDDQEDGAVEEPALLSPLEARILAALMEKQLTTPDAYPLSLNSLVLACNQKTSRAVQMNLDPGEVGHCVFQLRDKKLIEIDYGSRVDRFLQRLSRELFLDQQSQATVNILMLRGPQTLSDLLTKTQRMAQFEDIEAVAALIEKMLEKRQPIICCVGRQAGQREDRYMHLLCGQPEVSELIGMGEGRPQSYNKAGLEQRVVNLEQQVALLMELNGVSQSDVEEALAEKNTAE